MDPAATIHVTGEIDLTGIATALLALATFGLALWTRRSVKQGTTEIDRAHRPVLVPKVDLSQNFHPWGSPASPLVPALLYDDVYVPVRNVGAGPALNVKAKVDFGDDEGNPSSSGIEVAAESVVAGISHTEPWVILSFRNTRLSSMIGFVLTLAYEDVAGAGGPPWLGTRKPLSRSLTSRSSPRSGLYASRGV